MKIFLNLILLVTIAFLGTGCARVGRSFWEGMEPGCTAPGPRLTGGGPADIIPRSVLPPSPPNREVWRQNLDGSRSSYEVRDTQNYADWVWDSSLGKWVVVARQDTYSHRFVRIGPPVRYYPQMENVYPPIPKIPK